MLPRPIERTETAAKWLSWKTECIHLTLRRRRLAICYHGVSGFSPVFRGKPGYSEPTTWVEAIAKGWITFAAPQYIPRQHDQSVPE